METNGGRIHRKVGQFQTLQDYIYFPRSLLGEQRTKGIQEPPVLNGTKLAKYHWQVLHPGTKSMAKGQER